MNSNKHGIFPFKYVAPATPIPDQKDSGLISVTDLVNGIFDFNVLDSVNEFSVANMIVEQMKAIPCESRGIVESKSSRGFLRSDSTSTKSSSDERSAAKRFAEVERVVDELIALEESFCKQTGNVCQFILKATPPHCVTGDQISHVFQGFESLHSHSRNVLREMKLAREDGYTMLDGEIVNGPIAVPAIFCKYTVSFRAYTTYVQSYTHCKKLLSELALQKPFDKWLKEILNHSAWERMDISSLLMVCFL